MKRIGITIISSFLAVIMLFCGCATGSAQVIDNRIHDLDFVASALENTEFEMTSFSNTKDGFAMSGKSVMKKSQLTGICYVGVADEMVDVDYNVLYDKSDNVVDFSANAESVEFQETISFSPDMSLQGKFDGTIYCNGEEINVFQVSDIGEESIEECMFLSGILIGGIALWKIIAGIAVATVAISFVAYPEFYVRGLENIANGMQTVGKTVIDGMAFLLTKANERVIAQIKTNTDSKKYNKYYPTVLVNEHNIAEYPRANIGDTLISKYPVNKIQAIKNLRNGIHNFTTYGADAKNILRNAWIFGKITRDNAHNVGQFKHYHSSRGYVNGYHMHSFYSAD